MTIHILANIDSGLLKLAGKQAPYITSLALNRTAIGARDLVRENLPKRFRLRNNWTRGGIQARTSNKTSLVASVVAPDYMAIQETGGTRRPVQIKLLKAPGEALQGNRVIPQAKRPRALLAEKAFIIGMGDRGAGVFIRYGKARGQIRLLWWLSPEQEYQDRFEFETDVNDYVQDRFSSHFLAEWSKVIGEGGYAQSASRGRKKQDKPADSTRRQHRRTRF